MDSHIQTDGLILRHVTLDDVDDIQACIHDPRIYRMLARVAANQSRQVTQDWVLTHEEARAANLHHVYAIVSEDKFCGVIGLHRSATSDPFNLGFWLSPKVWGKGYMTAAGKTLLANLETNKGVQKTVSGYFTDNPASGRVLEKLGYVQTGQNQVHCLGRGETIPHITVARDISL